MKKSLLIASLALLGTGSVMAQLSFQNANNRLTNSSFRSGCAVTVVDANADGMDDIIRMDQGHLINLELQKKDGTFENHFLADIGGGSAWAMTTADVDHNGWKDIIADGSGGIWFVKVFENAGVISATTSILGNSGFFLQNATFCDMNNDGWIDIFCCDDNAAAHLYLNDGTGNLNLSTFVNFAVNPGVTYGGDPADSGNYGSAWIDFDNDGDLDLYVAHCRQSSSSPTDLRRINRLFVNDGNNNYTEMANAYGIDVGWQTWTSSFGDIDNDGDLDLMLTNHDHTSQIFENDGSGHYSELTTTGFQTSSITPIESVMEDFDNDGFVDILVAGSEWVYWKNNGNKTFTQLSNLFDYNGMLSFGIGDLNHDGSIDVYASYGDIYQSPSPNYDDVLFLNNGNSNHFITFSLEGTASNKGAIGAKATIYGPWGTQIREVRAGESYGTCNSSQLHFGLGANAQVDSAVISWPSGQTTTFGTLQANQFVTVVEGGCVITGNVIPGPYILCTGQTLNLNAQPGYSSYLWSDGSTGTSLTVSAAGIYNVEVVDNGGCSNISPSVTVQLNPDETPTVSSAGDLVFCQGGSVTLTSTPASSYLWSDGSTSQSITVNQSGNYALTIQGTCGAFTSAPTTVNVLAAPLPVGTGAAGPSPSSLVLTATGTNLEWYDQQTGGTLLGSGPSFTTPLLNTTTTYWVQSTTEYAGAAHNTGMLYHEGTQFSGPTTNSSITFDVFSPCTLASVKVYTDTPGNREIQLLDNQGNVVNSALVNIPMDTSIVTLNFPLTVGNAFQLTTNGTINSQNIGTVSPRLRRSSINVTYPYIVNNLVQLTGNNLNNGFYYYFYDWVVEEPSYECVSDRVPVIADITTGISSVDVATGISVYPNPANDFINIEFPANSKQIQKVSLIDVTGRIVTSQVYDGSDVSKTSFNLKGIAKGSYSLKINTTSGEVTKRFVIN